MTLARSEDFKCCRAESCHAQPQAFILREMNQLVHSIPGNTVPVKRKSGMPPASRTNDPARTMTGILEVATAEFASKGLSGARIDQIAAATQTSKRMIYYYFGSKEGLYVAVLEESYRRMRSIEAELQLDNLVEAPHSVWVKSTARSARLPRR